MHIYTRHAYRDGKKVNEERLVLGGSELYRQTSRVGRTAFLELINRWNSVGLLGVAQSGVVYVFVAEPADGG